MEPGEKSPGFNISNLADKVTNVDGKMFRKDGLPLLPRRNILFNSSKAEGPRVDVTMVKPDEGSKDDPDDANSVKIDVVPAKSDSKPILSYAEAASSEKLDSASGKNGVGSANRKINFRFIDPVNPAPEGVDVQIPMSSVLEANSKFAFTLYGYFLGKRVAFPVVRQYVLNSWKKFGITNVMMNAKGFFFFKFNSAAGLEGVLENGPWFIRSVPIVLKKWTADSALLKEDLLSVPVWVKLHDVPVAAFTEDGLSAIASKLGSPLLLDSYTSNMCISSWGRLDFARALIDIRADHDLKHSLVISIPSAVDLNVSLHSIKVEYEWKPPRCSTCQIFGHETPQCPKHSGTTSQKAAPKNGPVQQKDSQEFQQVKRKPFKPFKGLMVGNQNKVTVGSKKQVYLPKSKESKEASKTSTSNSFEALNKFVPNVEPSMSTCKQLDSLVEDSQVNDRGKAKVQESTNMQVGNETSLYQRWKDAEGYQQWKETEGSDSDGDEVMDPFDYDMTDFLDSQERQGRKKR